VLEGARSEDQNNDSESGRLGSSGRILTVVWSDSHGRLVGSSRSSGRILTVVWTDDSESGRLICQSRSLARAVSRSSRSAHRSVRGRRRARLVVGVARCCSGACPDRRSAVVLASQATSVSRATTGQRADERVNFRPYDLRR
jgi:hypothetical protein